MTNAGVVIEKFVLAELAFNTSVNEAPEITVYSFSSNLDNGANLTVTVSFFSLLINTQCGNYNYTHHFHVMLTIYGHSPFPPLCPSILSISLLSFNFVISFSSHLGNVM